MRCLLAFGLCASLSFAANGFLIPEANPHSFRQGDAIQVAVNSLSSYETHLPYDYYSLPFCQPEDGVRPVDESFNPGSLISGLQLHTSPYQVRVNVHERTKQACAGITPGPLSATQAQDIKKMIDGKYRTRLVLDNLPITEYDLEKAVGGLKPGFELGVKDGDKYLIFNHLALNVVVNRVTQPGQPTAADRARKQAADSPTSAGEASQPAEWMIVGFEVMPCSIKRTAGEPLETVQCKPWGYPGNPEPQVVAEGEDVVYTYDVYWQEARIEWPHRWDAYLRSGGAAHWVAPVAAAMLLQAMALVLAVVLRRVTVRDMSPDVDESDVKVAAQRRWKTIAGDVFRAPPCIVNLAGMVGTGAQLLCAVAAALGLTAAGLLAPARRGAFLSAAPALYFGFCGVGGSVAVALLRSAQRSTAGWRSACLHTLARFPVIAAVLFYTATVCAASAGSAMAPHESVDHYLAALFLAVGIPTTFFSGGFALSAPLPPWPGVESKAPPAAAPPRLHLVTRCMLYVGAATLPLAALYIEAVYLMASAWSGFFFTTYVELTAVLTMTVVCVSQFSAMSTYLQLCAGDYNWWWPSFHRGGAAAVPLIIYAVVFRVTELPALDGAGLVLYGCYMATAVAAVYFCLGAVSFAGSLAFVFYTYSHLADASAEDTAEAEKLLPDVAV